MPNPSPLVTVGVCTYKRPEGIAKCLRSLLAQQTTFPYDIVVTENDPSRGSKAIIESIAQEAQEKGIEIRYRCEPEPNISIARNRCVAECRGEFLAFIDDDEWAPPDWLAMLVEVQREYDADAVHGLTTPEYAPDFPQAMKGLIDFRKYWREGMQVESTATGCTLFRLEALKSRELPFDPEFGKTGGEDTECTFFLFQKKGIKIIQSLKPVVYEFYPANRSAFSYYWRRAYREGFFQSKIYRMYYYRLAGGKVNLKRAARSLLSSLSGIPTLFYSPRRGVVVIASGIATFCGILAYYCRFGNVNHQS